MSTMAGFPFFPLEITKEGRVFDERQVGAVLDAVTEQGPQRPDGLLVLAHGWNNDMAEARTLYEGLLGNVRTLLDQRGGAAPELAVMGVFWPSKRFADEDLIPAGGAASAGVAAGGSRELPAEALKKELERLKGTFDQPDAEALEKAKTLVDRLEDSPPARREFADLLRSVLPHPADPHDDASDDFFQQSGEQLLDNLKAPIRLVNRRQGGGAAVVSDTDRREAGGAAGFGDLFTGFTAAAWKLLNYTTYYQMKERAGVVGRGLNAVLARVREARPDLDIHLVGHSFGARVVTAAVDGPVAFRPASLVLLQAAFSHNAFAENFDGHTDGFFRKVIGERKVAGPIVVTHTANDRAVGIAYAIASRISGDNRSELGDANDLFGGLGRNGAVRMREGEAMAGKLLDATGRYTLEAGPIHNLLADAHVASHNDVTNDAVANLLVAAIMERR